MPSPAAPDFPRSYLGAAQLGDDELANLSEAIHSKTLFRHYGLGTPHFTADFETKARELFGSRFALGVSSGSGALFCALAGIGVGPGDEVILPAFSWYACYNAIVCLGALPVFADSDTSLNLDPDRVKEKLTPRTKAVMVVHYQGAASRLDELVALCEAHDLALIEDCAQAMGASFQGRKLGTHGAVATFSLQGNKILTAGEGGLVLSSDPTIFERAVRYHDSGSCRPVFAEQLELSSGPATMPGAQFRMGELTGAVALAQLEKLEWMLGRCKHQWLRLRKLLSDAIPELRFRTSEVEGDAGITLFCDLGTPARAEAMSSALKDRDVRIGASSGMCNLLEQAYVQGKAQTHPALPPFGEGYAGAEVTYTPEQAPRIREILPRLVEIPIGPGYEDAHTDYIAHCFCELWPELP